MSSTKLRWLFWLRRKMFLRGFVRGGAGKIIGTIFLSIFILIGGGGVAVGTWFAYRYAPAPADTEILFLVLSGVFLIWILLPLLSINTNEGLDVSKLALFPLSRAEVMASTIISTLLDIPSMGVLLVLGAVVAGWAMSLPLALIAFAAMFVFYVLLIAVSQLILAILQPLLQSRRFRDLSILLTVVIACSGYLCNILSRGIASENFQNAVTSESFSPYLQWLPSGMAARTIEQAYHGNWGMSVLWLAALIAVTLVVLYLSMQLIAMSMTITAESQGTVQRTRRRRAPVEAAPLGGGLNLLPPQVARLIIKDLKYFWRDPQLKALFLQSLVSVVILIVAFAFPQASRNEAASSATISPWMVLWAPNVVLFSVFALAYNSLGIERQSLTVLMLFPINPRYILWAKNLVVAVVGIVEIVIVAVISSAISQGWALLVPTLAIGISGLAIILGIGNFMSVFFPQKMRLPGRGFRNNTNMSTEAGCLRSIVTLAAMLITVLVLSPVILGIVLPYIYGTIGIWGAVIPGALIYGVAIYLIVTWLVAPRILKRTPEIVGVVTRE